MRIESLQYFIVTAECQSITLSSKLLHISQQGISKEIRQLENELGTQLFLRSKQGVTLTPDGQRAYEAAAQIYKQLEAFSQMFLQTQAPLSFIIAACRSYMLPLDVILKLFQKTHLQATIDDYYCSIDQISIAMANGSIDFALQHLEKDSLTHSPLSPLYTHISLLEEPIQMFYSKNAAFDHLSSFELERLKDFPMVFYCESVVETPLFQQIAQRYAPKLNIIYKGNRAEKLQNHCMKDGAITLMTKSLASMGYKGMPAWLIPCDPPIMISTVLSIKSQLMEETYVQNFIEIFKSFFQQYAYE